MALNNTLEKEQIELYGNFMYININKSRLNSDNYIQAMRTWITNNPLTIVVGLATPTYEELQTNPTLNTYTDVTHISNNSTIPCNMQVKNSGLSLIGLAPNAKYTVVHNGSGTVGAYVGGSGGTTSTNGKVVITTSNKITDNEVRLYGKGVRVSDVMVLDGEVEHTNGNFKGLQSSFEGELVIDENDANCGKYKVETIVRGKNLWTDVDHLPNTWKTAGWTSGNVSYDNNTYSFGCHSGWQSYASDFPFDLNKTYSIRFKAKLNNVSSGTASSLRIIGYSSENLYEGEFVVHNVSSATDWMDCQFTFTPKMQQVGFGVWVRDEGVGYEANWSIKDIQLEEGAQVTPYEPYYERKSTVYLNSPLSKGDELVVKDDGLYHYHKMGKVLLNGSENWNVKTDLPKDNPQGTHLVFYVQDENLPIKVRPNDTSSIVWISDVVHPVSHTYGWNNSTEGLHFGTFSKSQGVNNCRYYINIAKSKLSTQDVQGFKQWLQTNNITVVYELAEPYYEKISDNQIIAEIPNNASLTLNSVVPCTSVKANYTSNVVSVYGLEKTNQKQDDLIDITLMATDEMFMMLEPLLMSVTMSERGVSKMVDMYVAMVQRGLKTIEEVPARYREQVKKVLAQLEK